jgi:hypothetical protein
VSELTRCSCGTSYRLDDDLTGEKIRCVGCGEMLRVGKDYRDDDDRPSRRNRDEEDDRPARKRKKRRRKRSSGPLVETWILDLVGGGIVGGLALLCLALAAVSPGMGIVSYAMGIMISMASGIWILVLAFREDAMTGFLCLCLPFYSLGFIFNNFDDCKRPFCYNMVGALLLGVGVATQTG